MNILLVTLDQFRADHLACAGHPVVRTPNLDRLAAEGVRFARHYGQAAPCSPGRASLYTGLYQMNHRVVGNGTPLDDRFDNVARAARRAGYDPTLFGYTDQSIDPRVTDGPDDPRLQTYEEILPGFSVGCRLAAGDPAVWMDWLRGLGHEIPDDPDAALAGESERPEAHSMTAFLTDRFLAWLDRRSGPWFAHLSHFRPHPPYAAAGRYAAMFDADQAIDPIPPATEAELHKLHRGLLREPLMTPPAGSQAQRAMIAQYYGMIAEVDAQLGRVWSALEAAGAWDDTLILVTSDHGEMLGDHGLVQKGGWFEASYHIPCIVRDPRPGGVRGAVVEAFTEAVDVLPTLCEAMEIAPPAQCDGFPLTPFLRGEAPPHWRTAAHWEWDWRASLIPRGPQALPWDRRLERQNLAVHRDATHGLVQFGDGTLLCFDLAADPTWRTPERDPAVILSKAQALLAWRSQTLDRTLTGMLVENGGMGRWPAMPSDWMERSRVEA